MSRLFDIQHPDITAAERTGYPDSRYALMMPCYCCGQDIPAHQEQIIGEYVVCPYCYEAIEEENDE